MKPSIKRLLFTVAFVLTMTPYSTALPLQIRQSKDQLCSDMKTIKNQLIGIIADDHGDAAVIDETVDMLKREVANVIASSCQRDKALASCPKLQELSDFLVADGMNAPAVPDLLSIAPRVEFDLGCRERGGKV